ncbi:uncharacterized protein MYCFIDRAFT_82325 [Pseudocercospora fijiensis CIRAD86]|uniref:Thioredoxin domain-containing protein n=1 Tax=Pseudocercospora fijiensis (strain CIRAD86) TaxID=383855 RepID=M3AYX6_PSEFD|nr:uncharacterized protein MYCFIDRAFT_82325 [Pseudocercospora fijiensis CIRAD86]EME82407.1 hypothetical protein MYCFIDRAFT_82325 [Pseudocercospora fijiensis CIRAD86]
MAEDGFESESDFAKLLQTSGKNVLIYAYEGYIPPRAKDLAKMFSHTTISYMVDVAQHLEAEDYFGIIEVPTFIVYRNGEEIKRVLGMDPAGLESLLKILA